jgi:hypothetical protein
MVKTPIANYAIHETGHVVVCQVLGIQMIRATARPPEPSIDFGDQPRDDHSSWLCMWVAGLVAEHLYGAETDRLPLISAQFGKRDYSHFFRNADEDATQARTAASRLGVCLGLTEHECLLAAEERASDILRRHVSAVRAIEAELQQKEEITYARAKELLDLFRSPESH